MIFISSPCETHKSRMLLPRVTIKTSISVCLRWWYRKPIQNNSASHRHLSIDERRYDLTVQKKRSSLYKRSEPAREARAHPQAYELVACHRLRRLSFLTFSLSL